MQPAPASEILERKGIDMDIGGLFKAREAWNKFTTTHPKVPGFLNSVKNKGFEEGQEIAIAIRYPDGTEFKTGIRVQQSDLELLELARSLSK